MSESKYIEVFPSQTCLEQIKSYFRGYNNKKLNDFLFSPSESSIIIKKVFKTFYFSDTIYFMDINGNKYYSSKVLHKINILNNNNIKCFVKA